MRRNVFRACSLLLVLVMLLGIFTACGSSQGSSNTQASDASKAQTAATTAPKGPPVELTVEVFDRATPGQTPVDNNYWTKWIQEKFGTPNNINLKFVPCPRSQEVEKLNVWMAAGQAPDLSLTYDVNVVYNYYKNGGLAELTDALNQNGPQLKEYLKDTLSYGQYDGKQYAIPAKRVMQAQFGTFIRKDWLDKLGLAMPQTTEEFYNVLKAFKEKNPGKVDKVVPLSMTNDVRWVGQGWFESFMEPMTDEEKYVNQYLFLKGYKEGARFLNKMYNEGLISPEFALDKDGKMSDQDITRGVVGAYQSNYDFAMRVVPGHITNLKKNVPDAQLVPCDPFTNKYTGKHQKRNYDPTGIRIIVPKSSKHVNEAIKYLNWMANKDVIFFLQNGNEGIGHTLVNGLPKVLAPKGEQMFDSPQNIDYTLILNGIDLGTKEQNIKVNAMSYPGYEDLYESAVKFATTDAYVMPTLPVPVDADAKYGKTLLEKEKEIYAKAITAKPADFDKVWDSQLQEYLKMGGQEVIDQRRAAWKEAHK
ncbi:MAG: extracellular solute-binding protein [Caulobacteraceae bacterium]